MATYDLTTTTPSKIKTGDILNCPYSGAAKSITLPKGTYKLECWGAQGGGYSATPGGKGGYSSGALSIKDKTLIYLYSGECPESVTTSTTTFSPGFNGGGTGNNMTAISYRYVGASGGGGTDIRIKEDSLYARVIVAGGGGGALYSSRYRVAYSGSIGNASGEFGQGADCYISIGGTRGAGGGGWYGGMSNLETSPSAGGQCGSSYTYTSATASNYPSGCLLTSDYYLTDAQTITGNTTFTSPTGESETGHTGNGYIRITALDVKSGNTLVKTNSATWKNYKNMYVKVNSTTWKKVKAAWVKTNSTTWKQAL